jgi:hypothetical protein
MSLKQRPRAWLCLVLFSLVLQILLWRTSTRLDARYSSAAGGRTTGNIYRRSFSTEAADEQDDGPGTLLNIDYSEWYFSSSKAYRPFVFTALVMWYVFSLQRAFIATRSSLVNIV